MTEWANKEFEPKLSKNEFRKIVLQQCSSLEIMRDLANGTKHYQLTRENSLVKRTELHCGVFSKEFSREFDTSHLKIILGDGTKIYFEDEIKKVISFWTQYLESTLNIIIT